MKPIDTYCTLDRSNYEIVGVFITKPKAEAFTKKRIKEYKNSGLISILPNRYVTLTLDEAIEEIKDDVKDSMSVHY